MRPSFRNGNEYRYPVQKIMASTFSELPSGKTTESLVMRTKGGLCSISFGNEGGNSSAFLLWQTITLNIYINRNVCCDLKTIYHLSKGWNTGIAKGVVKINSMSNFAHLAIFLFDYNYCCFQLFFSILSLYSYCGHCSRDTNLISYCSEIFPM